MDADRPTQSFDAGLQHERTALAWERTAIAVVVNGVLLARYAAQDAHWAIASAGLAETLLGSGLLVWTGFHYDELHGALRAGDSIVHASLTRFVGLAVTAFMAVSLALAVAVAVSWPG